MVSRSSSCSALPPVAGAAPSRGGRSVRSRDEAPKRVNFLEGLLNDDLQQLTKWHGTRSALEQKNFLKSVDMLYKDFTALDQGQGGRAPKLAPSQKQLRQEQRTAEAAFEAAEAAESDPLARPGTPPTRGMAQSRSEGSIPSKPIDVFAHNKKRGIRSRSGREDDNSLAKWLEAQSISSRTTATNQTRQTTFSQMSRTSAGSGSVCSDPGTTNQAVFRQHKRALALNRANWAAADQNSACYLKDGLGIGIPDEARHQTMAKEFFGSATIGATVPKGLYENVISENKQKQVEQWLESAPVDKKAQLGGMLRSLQFLRRERAMGTKSLAGNDFDLAENRRLFHPSVQKPVRSSANANYSRVPMGTGAGYINPNSKAQLEEMPAQTARPSSPGVSELGSVRLGTARSLATPLIAGRDMPLASAPPVVGMHGK